MKLSLESILKRLSLFVLLMGLAACGDDASKSKTSNNVANNTTNNTTTNNTTNNAPNNLASDDIAQALWGMLCDSTFECPSPDLLIIIGRYPSVEACKSAEIPSFLDFPDFDRELARGNTVYDSAKAAVCLEAWRGSICEGSFANPPPECDEVFVGTQLEGEECISETECAEGRTCEIATDACEGICANNCGDFNCLDTEFCSATGCVEKGALAASCESFEECQRGLYCINSICSTGGTTAERGECAFNGECSGDLICISSKCQPFDPPAAGEACTLGEFSTYCEAGSVCTDLVLGTDELDGTCGPTKAAGEECRVFYECATGLTCDAPDFVTPGVCTPLRAIGAACNNQFDCASGVCESDVCALPMVCM